MTSIGALGNALPGQKAKIRKSSSSSESAKDAARTNTGRRKFKELIPIKETTADFDRMEAALVQWFRAELYAPVMKMIGQPTKRLANAKTVNPLVDAIQSGRVTFYRGTFSGRTGAEVSKELRRLGASFDRKSGAWKLPASALPPDIRIAVSAAESRFERVLAGIDRKLAQILPAEIAERLSVASLFDSSLGKVERNFRKTVKGITVPPELTDERRRRLSEEWQSNMRLWVKDFTEAEITKLRADLQEKAFAGNRYESAVKTIQESYGVSVNKAKFLARQETSLLMTKFQETRYTEAGVNEYRWGCVKMPHDKTPGEHVKGNVRYSHGLLEGKIFAWNSPPITSQPGESVRRNNPGQDYNCRCFAIPLVRF